MAQKDHAIPDSHLAGLGEVLDYTFRNHRRRLVSELVVDGRQFVSNQPTEEAAREIVANFPDAEVRAYRVKILRVDPKTRVATEWEKVAGFSVWK